MKKNRVLYRIKAFLTAISLMIGILLPMEVFAGQLPYAYDESGTLTAQQQTTLEGALEQLSTNYGMDVLLYMTDNEALTDPEVAADDYYDFNGFGTGSNRDGVLLYINTANRKLHISTRGYGIEAFTDAGIAYIGDQIAPYLTDGDYYGGCEEFVALSDDFIAHALNGEPYTSKSLPKGPFPLVRNLLIAIVIGLIVAAIYIGILKGELKSVAPNDSAADYVVSGSMHVTGSREMFLYRNVTKTKKQQNNGSGSSTHTSSSGATHGGGGRSF